MTAYSPANGPMRGRADGLVKMSHLLNETVPPATTEP